MLTLVKKQLRPWVRVRKGWQRAVTMDGDLWIHIVKLGKKWAIRPSTSENEIGPSVGCAYPLLHEARAVAVEIYGKFPPEPARPFSLDTSTLPEKEDNVVPLKPPAKPEKKNASDFLLEEMKARVGQMAALQAILERKGMSVSFDDVVVIRSCQGGFQVEWNDEDVPDDFCGLFTNDFEKAYLEWVRLCELWEPEL